MQADFGEFEASSTAMHNSNSQQHVPMDNTNNESNDPDDLEEVILPAGTEEITDEDEDSSNPSGKRKRKYTSPAWEDFKRVRVNGVQLAKCRHCSVCLKRNQGTTTGLNRHRRSCLQKKLKNQSIINFQPVQSENELPILSTGKYDHKRQRVAIAHWILAKQMPFNVVEDVTFTNMFKVNLPLYEKVRRDHAKSECMEVYETERKRVKDELAALKHISLTTDLWKFESQKRSYMCVTGHFLDRDWKLQKRVLSFVPLPPPHGGPDITHGLRDCIRDWGIENKVYSISVNNATNNDSAMRIMRAKLGFCSGSA